MLWLRLPLPPPPTPGTAGRSSLDLQTSRDTWGRTLGSSRTGASPPGAGSGWAPGVAPCPSPGPSLRAARPPCTLGCCKDEAAVAWQAPEGPRPPTGACARGARPPATGVPAGAGARAGSAGSRGRRAGLWHQPRPQLTSARAVGHGGCLRRGRELCRRGSQPGWVSWGPLDHSGQKPRVCSPPRPSVLGQRRPHSTWGAGDRCGSAPAFLMPQNARGLSSRPH